MVLMSNNKAFRWLTQPGVLATIFHYDSDTNDALRTAIVNLAPDQATKEQLLQQLKNAERRAV